MSWITPVAESRVNHFVQKFSKLMLPKPGRRKDKALKEIHRQRGERLEMIETLRAEAAALYIIARALETDTLQATLDADLCKLISQ